MSSAGNMSDPAAAAAAQHAMEVAQKQGQAIIIWTVGMFCIMGWEWLACLPKEIKRIWQKKFTYISWVYLINRYYGLVQFALVIPLLTSAFSADECIKIFRWQPVGAMLSTLLCQFILGARVYLLYSHNLIVAGVLGTIYLAEFCIFAYTQTIVFPAPAPAPGVIVPCVAIGPTPWLIAFWALPLGYDTLTFAFTAYKTYTYWRMEVQTPVLTLIFRDGLFYFTAIFVMNLLNVILFNTMPPALQAVNLPATAMLNIIMSCRLVLNVRKDQARERVAPHSYRTTHGVTTTMGDGMISTIAPSSVGGYQMTDLQKAEAGEMMVLPKAKSETDAGSQRERTSSVERGSYGYNDQKPVW